jgi:hypothetical protein
MAQFLMDQVWNESMKSNDASFSRLINSQPDKIAPVLTRMMGAESSRFPLMYLSEGMQAIQEVEADEFEYDVVGRMMKAVPLQAPPSGSYASNFGVSYTEATLYFAEGIFPVGYTILSPNGYQLRITSRTNDNGAWAYRVKLVAKNASEFLPATELASGSLYALGWNAVASFGSFGSLSTSTAPVKVRGDVGTIRKGYAYEGNIKYRKAKTVQLDTKGGGNREMYWPYEEYQHNLSFRVECETNFWYSKSNRDAYGVINERDEQGNPIVRGSGMFEQISNKDTYGTLTADKIDQTLRDAFYGMSDAENKVVTLFTGVGGRFVFDQAMKTELSNRGYIKLTDNKFVGGSGYKLSLGGFFDTYEHVDGYKVIIKTASLFDNGPQALASPRHPNYPNLPLESFRMTFVDTSTYDGMSNLTMVSKKGRSMLRGMVKGINEAASGTDFTANDIISTDKDGSSVHFLKAGQVVLRRFNTSIDLQCVAGL